MAASILVGSCERRAWLRRARADALGDRKRMD
jgi:hypothetical protein